MPRIRPRLPLAALLALALCGACRAGAQELQIVGGGDGHGVGLSQWGAYGYALHGATYTQILAAYYTGTALATVPPTAVVYVLLQGNVGSASLRGAARVRGASGASRALNPKRTYQAALAGAGSVRIGRFTLPAPVVVVPGPRPMRLLGSAQNGLANGTYRGQLVLRPAVKGGMNVINRLSVDDYVRGVIGAESVPSWPAAALEAQAVASRSYALTSVDAAAGAGFTMYADTRSQVYRGVAAETPSTNAAALATAGQVVTYAGKPVVTYFFSSSGGHTENVENAFPGAAPEPWLKGVPDPYDTTSPEHKWTHRMSFAAAGARLGALVKGSLSGIEVLTRGVSPRVLTAEVLGTGGTTATTGATLAAKLGLPSTWEVFSVIEPNGSVIAEPDKSGQSLLPPAPGTPGAAAGPTGGTSPA